MRSLLARPSNCDVAYCTNPATQADGRCQIHSNTSAPKPQPPADLWEQIDAALADVAPSKPPGSFSALEFQQRMGIASRDTAYRKLRKLMDAGKVRRMGAGSQQYYELVKP